MVLTFVFAAAALQGGSNSDLASSVLVVGKDAIYQMDAEPIAKDATDLEWSPDGTYLLVRSNHFTDRRFLMKAVKGTATEPPVIVQDFLVYSTVSGKTTNPLTLPEKVRVQGISWFTGASKFLVSVSVTEPEGGDYGGIYLVGVNGPARPLFTDLRFDSVSVVASPYRPVVVLQGQIFKQTGYRMSVEVTNLVVDSEGKLLCRFQNPEAEEVSFAPDGRVMVSTTKLVNRKLETTWFSVNLANGSLKREPNYQRMDLPASAFGDQGSQPRAAPPGSESLPQAAPARVKNPVELRYRVEVQDNSLRLPTPGDIPSYMHSVVLKEIEKPDHVVLVSTDARQGTLAPNLSAVAYIHKGTAMIRPLVVGPKELYENMLLAAKKSELISNAKQVATAFMLYGADMDDELPAAGSDWQETIFPYLKNRDVMSGFVYSFGGGNLNNVESPAETVLGYTPGLGGYAVAFVDGHVKWFTELPKMKP